MEILYLDFVSLGLSPSVLQKFIFVGGVDVEMGQFKALDLA